MYTRTSGSSYTYTENSTAWVMCRQHTKIIQQILYHKPTILFYLLRSRTINSHNDMQSSYHNVGTMLSVSLKQQSSDENKKKMKAKQRKKAGLPDENKENMTCLSSICWLLPTDIGSSKFLLRYWIFPCAMWSWENFVSAEFSWT